MEWEIINNEEIEIDEIETEEIETETEEIDIDEIDIDELEEVKNTDIDNKVNKILSTPLTYIKKTIFRRLIKSNSVKEFKTKIFLKTLSCTNLTYLNNIPSRDSLLFIAKSAVSVISVTSSIKSVVSVVHKVPSSFLLNTPRVLHFMHTPRVLHFMHTGICILKYSSNIDWRIRLLCSTASTCIFILRNRRFIYYLIEIRK